MTTMSDYAIEWRVAAAPRVWLTKDAPDVVLDSVRRAEMNPELAQLDKLLKD